MRMTCRAGLGAWLATACVLASTVHAEPGYVHATGNLILTSSSNLVIELAGPMRGTEYDAIDVDGTLVIRGTLSLECLGGYVPGFLVPHHVLHAGTRDGVFRSVSGIGVSPVRSLAVTYVGDDIHVIATVPGDADVEGTVDFGDLLALAQHYGDVQNRTWQNGDFTGNGAVGFDDLLLLTQHYGQSVLRATDGAALKDPAKREAEFIQTVFPEPGSILLGIGWVGCRSRRFRRV